MFAADGVSVEPLGRDERQRASGSASARKLRSGKNGKCTPISAIDEAHDEAHDEPHDEPHDQAHDQAH